ncbi:hypothetical protein CHU92_03380 [Flavobacterium cyanobacteriorum]|uniref:Uncharacterized protein n=1 Tax=Flavobacterium cyanobacteriorum TaxID=2022802 RepID=A0A255ZPW1_9FLAO|nr:hypothetical protein [Flavobacterium cyanobacteriorum]OYQ43496.1 hypothetical protein CHU92_03380 [Flavobacterium cyanobacteriorum]
MKTNLKKSIALLVLCFTAMAFNQVQAQTKYGFATFEKFDTEKETYYLVISDPVKNWFSSLSKQEREDWQTDFRTSANRQAGFELMPSYDKPVPYNGEYEKFSSLSDCKASIQDVVNEFKKKKGGYDKPVKVIYVNLNRY